MGGGGGGGGSGKDLIVSFKSISGISHSIILEVIVWTKGVTDEPTDSWTHGHWDNLIPISTPPNYIVGAGTKQGKPHMHT